VPFGSPIDPLKELDRTQFVDQVSFRLQLGLQEVFLSFHQLFFISHQRKDELAHQQLGVAFLETGQASFL